MSEKKITKITKNEKLSLPCRGRLLKMEDIPDDAFAKGMLGKCFGVMPDQGIIYSPCNGTVEMVADTRHAITLKSDKSNLIMLHIGIDTVLLDGEGFDVKVSAGQRVKTGDVLLNADLSVLKSANLSPVVVVASIED